MNRNVPWYLRSLGTLIITTESHITLKNVKLSKKNLNHRQAVDNSDSVSDCMKCSEADQTDMGEYFGKYW